MTPPVLQDPPTAATDDNVATVRPRDVIRAIQDTMWEAVYGPAQVG
jgi:hypothetical protein